jgi:hypothetical protein
MLSMATRAGHERGLFSFWLVSLVAAPVLATCIAFALSIKAKKSPLAYAEFFLMLVLVNIGLLFLHAIVFLLVNWREFIPVLPVGDM